MAAFYAFVMRRPITFFRPRRIHHSAKITFGTKPSHATSRYTSIRGGSNARTMAHFEKQDWYMAVSQDITDKLTAREKKNAALIKRCENYGAEYYDSFGR